MEGNQALMIISWIQLCLKPPPDHFSYIKMVILQSVEPGSVPLMMERDLSHILSLSAMKDTATQEQNPRLALKHSAQVLALKITKKKKERKKEMICLVAERFLECSFTVDLLTKNRHFIHFFLSG